MATVIPFNPLERDNLAEAVARELLLQPLRPLAGIRRFLGAGLYVIYYFGTEQPYTALGERNRDGSGSMPIYLGKADANSTRTGVGVQPSAHSDSLYKRLNDHRKSISAASGSFSIEDFQCRYLVVDDIFIALAESLLLSRHQPVWNSILSGFGNHAAGSGRHAGERTRWDTLHPGRSHATHQKTRTGETQADILRDVEAYIAARL